MKRNCIGKVLFRHSRVGGNRNAIIGITKLLIIALLLASCQPKPKTAHHDLGKVEIDSVLRALVQPSNQQVVGNVATVKANYESKILTIESQGIINYDSRNETSIASRVTGRLEKLYIKYNYQPVKKGQLLFEIYAPDLAAAQQELIYLSQSNDVYLLAQAKQRLRLLGMTEQSIQKVLQAKKVNYRIPVYSQTDGYILEKNLVNTTVSVPSTITDGNVGGDGMSGMGTSSSTVTPPTANVQPSSVMLREGQYVNAGETLFTVYRADQLLAEFALKPSVATFIQKGSKLALYKITDKEGSFEIASIGLIQPLIKAGENFTLARVYLSNRNFKVGELVTAKIPIWVSSSYWLPESAVINVGAQNMVFKKEADIFVAKPVQIGLRANGLVQVKEDIGNWDLAKNTAYLVDSESFIKVKSKKSDAR